jgi:hypothetical protein
MEGIRTSCASGAWRKKGIVALKRYSDAVRDGDHIYGILLDVRTNNSGEGMLESAVISGFLCMTKRSNDSPQFVN